MLYTHNWFSPWKVPCRRRNRRLKRYFPNFHKEKETSITSAKNTRRTETAYPLWQNTGKPLPNRVVGVGGWKRKNEHLPFFQATVARLAADRNKTASRDAKIQPIRLLSASNR